MKHWLSAFRLRTLPLALSSILVGSGLAYRFGELVRTAPRFKWSVFVLSIVTALLLQILSNLANDLGDHQHGTDNEDRVGPRRAVQSGAISPAAMKRAMVVCGLLAFGSGLGLITIALGLTTSTLVFLLLGLAAIAAAVKYTFGKNPYGYAGLGDLSVFGFFGLIGVGGTFFLQERWLLTWLVEPAVAFGLLSTGVLNLNNMRDIVNDAASGKRTLVVRVGSKSAKVYHTALVAGAIHLLILFTIRSEAGWAKWLFLLPMPVLIMHLSRVWSNHEPRLLDPQLKTLAMTTFFTAILFSLGLILA